MRWSHQLILGRVRLKDGIIIETSAWNPLEATNWRSHHTSIEASYLNLAISIIPKISVLVGTVKRVIIYRRRKFPVQIDSSALHRKIDSTYINLGPKKFIDHVKTLYHKPSAIGTLLDVNSLHSLCTKDFRSDQKNAQSGRYPSDIHHYKHSWEVANPR